MPNTDFFKQMLSASSDGAGVAITTSTSPGDLIHAAFSDATKMDEVAIYAVNNHTSDVTLTLLLGGVATKDQVKVSLSANSGLNLVVPALLFRNTLSIRGFASSPNAVNVFGNVNRAGT